MDFYTFLVSSLIIILMPGARVLYVLSIGYMIGRRTSLLAALGCITGMIPHLCAGIFLSAWLIKINSEATALLKLLGALYLLYLDGATLLSKTQLKFIREKNHTAIIILRGLWINLLNPKLMLFFFSFLPQYVNLNH